MIIHPQYLYAALTTAEYESYRERRTVRSRQTYKAMSEMMIKNNLVRVKERPPYSPELEDKVLMNSMARAVPEPKTGSYVFTPDYETKPVVDTSNAKTISDIAAQSAAASSEFVGVGVDQGMLPCSPKAIL